MNPLYNQNPKLEKIILNTNTDELLMWGNTVKIEQPYKIKFRVEGGYDTLHIEFDSAKHLEYAKKLQKRIADCIEQMINPEIEKDLKIVQYNNQETGQPRIKFSVLMPKYEFMVSESRNIE